MRTRFHQRWSLILVPLLVIGGVVWSMTAAARQSGMAEGIIAGTVISDNGPEAGVWVIAETNELDTKFAKIVVTDDRGQFVLPQLPDAAYDVWVRGYGLVDSKKVTHSPGDEGVALRELWPRRQVTQPSTTPETTGTRWSSHPLPMNSQGPGQRATAFQRV